MFLIIFLSLLSFFLDFYFFASFLNTLALSSFIVLLILLLANERQKHIFTYVILYSLLIDLSVSTLPFGLFIILNTVIAFIIIKIRDIVAPINTLFTITAFAFLSCILYFFGMNLTVYVISSHYNQINIGKILIYVGLNAGLAGIFWHIVSKFFNISNKIFFIRK